MVKWYRLFGASYAITTNKLPVETLRTILSSKVPYITSILILITAHLGACGSFLKQECATNSQISMSNFNTVFLWSGPGQPSTVSQSVGAKMSGLHVLRL